MQMRHVFTLIFFCLVLTVHAQISGEGEIVTQEIQLGTITGIALSINGDVVVTQGTPQKIVMEGQQNILDNIKRDVHDGTWVIRYDKKVRSSKKVMIRMTVETLEEIAVAGSGSVVSATPFTGLDELEIAVSGSGNVNFHAEAREVECAISGSGDIILKGMAQSLEIAISGSGNVNAQALQAADCEVSISGSGDALVYCTEELETAIAGSGDVRYKGDAPKVRAQVSGSGDVRRID